MREEELEARWNELVSRLMAERVLRSEAVIRAMRKVPRYRFVPERLRRYAHVDTPLPIGHGQTVSAPHGSASPAGRARHGGHNERGPRPPGWP